MNDLLGTLMEQLTERNAVSAIGKQVGTDSQATTKALQYAIPVLLGALANNTAKSDGADALSNALTKDHDGSILNDIMGAVTDGANNRVGANILKHILGSQQKSVEQQLSSQTGLSAAGIGQIMEIAAPILLGMLGKQKRENNLGASAIASLLGGAKQQAADAPFGPSMDMLGALLGDDNSSKSGIMGVGMNLLKGFLKK